MAQATRTNGRRVVVALGGNAILQPGQVGTFEEQLFNIDQAMRRIAQLVEDGWQVVLTHGNGPQVGNLLIQNALAAKTIAPMPMDVCGAMSQGQIGYMLEQSLLNHLRTRRLDVPVVTVLTQMAVDPGDKAFADPSKPVGPFYSEAEARKMMLEEGLVMREDAGRGWRRVVPSPEPREIVPRQAVVDLVDDGLCVICSGGGGVPVVRRRGALSGIDAVIDKDLAAAVLAENVSADSLLILTDVPNAFVHYKSPQQQALGHVTVAEMESYAAGGHFKAGSMGPKVQACLRFARGGGEAIIGSLTQVLQDMRGEAGTHIVPDGAPRTAAATTRNAAPGARRQAGTAAPPIRRHFIMTTLIASTPRADGFRMPGEFEPHGQAWMLWPQRPDNWRFGAKPAQRAWVQVATAIAQFEPVTVGVAHDQYENARLKLPPQVRVVELSSNDAWIRDCGPTFVVDDKGGVRLVHWDFNAWGGLYDGLYFPWDKDQLVPLKVAEIEGVDRYKAPLVLEGGSIHVDGQGTVLTTEECLLSPGRNPDLSQEQIEQHLRDYLGVEKVVWLGRGIDPEETNGHVDDVACFVRPGVVLAAVTEDRDDWRYELLQDNLRRLQLATDARGRRLDVLPVPMPAIMEITEEEAWGVDAAEGSIPRRAGDKTAASYLNFLIVNGGVVMPTFDDPLDEVAAKIVRDAFPDRRVVTVPGREIVLGGGNVHCITQQQPRG